MLALHRVLGMEEGLVFFVSTLGSNFGIWNVSQAFWVPGLLMDIGGIR